MVSGKDTTVLSILFYILVGSLLTPLSYSHIECTAMTSIQGGLDSAISNSLEDFQMGNLDPVMIEHSASTFGMTTSSSARTDVIKSPSSEVWVPVGGSENRQSAECNGGYFLVGESGSTSFSSSEGTISFWLKFHSISSTTKLWGQDDDFEIRFSSNRIVLDWGTESTVQGQKNDWEISHWYFIAVTWNQSSNSLRIFWGDESIAPQGDFSIDTWSYDVIGSHTANCIMNSLSEPNSEVNGNVDDFRYYDVQRTLLEIRSDYRKPSIDTELHLEHWYSFESDFTDSIGTSNLEQIGACDLSWDVIALDNTWIAEQVKINVNDIDRLYALNGTFDTGNPGTNVDWSGDGLYYADGWYARREAVTGLGRQRTAYIYSDSRYIFIENEGFEMQVPTRYRHYNKTQIYWYQDVDNSLLEDQFEFSMKYNYQSGPIGTHYADEFQFNFQILNGSFVLWEWSIDPTNISSRGTWYSVPKTCLTIPSVPASFQLRVSLTIRTNTSYIEIPDDDSDLDGDSANGHFIGFLIDDVSLISVDSPSPAAVDLSVNFQGLGLFNFDSSLDSCTLLVNHSYWTTASIGFSFASNISISFDYSAFVSKMRKITNSSCAPNLIENGVGYRVEQNAPIELLLYTYIESYPEATNLGFLVHHPDDWKHIEIINPFGTTFSHDVVEQSDSLELPMGFVDSVGWWKISLESPNYLNDLKTQSKEDSGWHNASIFHCDENIRCVSKLGTSNETLDTMTNVTFSWYTPDGVLWSNQTITQCNETEVYSHSFTLVSSNTTIGDWYVSVKWENGTEVAYGSHIFQIHHKLTVFAQTPSIDIRHGEGFTAVIYVYDYDYGIPIHSGATVIGNWSTGEVIFNPNLAKGWFEADLNTSQIEAGIYTILIEVSLPYYESNTCVMSIDISAPESLVMVALRAGFATAVGLLSLIGISYLGRRYYKSRITKNNLELLSLKGRLEDAMNLVGILVIHRASGLPIYSRIFKGVFQEALLSSFISAISQFRSEVSTKQPHWLAVPISDVVTAVQTENMICAVVTDESISVILKDKLESFSHKVGFLYDSDDRILNVVVQRAEIEKKFDSILFNYFDWKLLRKYVGIKEDIPDNWKVIADVMSSTNVAGGLSVNAIINEVFRRGYSERRAYRFVISAIDEGYLIAVSDEFP